MKEELLKLRTQIKSKLENLEEEKKDTTRVNEFMYHFLEDVENLENDRVYYEQYELGDFALQEDGESLEPILNTYKENVMKTGLNPASGSHLGYIPGCGLYTSALADYLAAVTDEYASVNFASPGAVRMENTMCRWMADLIGFGPEAYGVLTEGGSAANLMAVVVAREARGIKPRDFEKQVFYLTQQTHHCLYKGIKTAGLLESQFRFIEMNEEYQMKVDQLAEQLKKDKADGYEPFMIIGNAGSTDVGAVDPLNELAQIAEEENVWFHVDGAYGGGFLLVNEMKSIFNGVERADSVVIDPHKGFFLPYGTGALIVKNGSYLLNAFKKEANYMQDTKVAQFDVSPADASFELSRHFRGLRMWMPLRQYGLAVIRDALREKVMLCNYFLSKVSEIDGVEVGNKPHLSVGIFRFFKDDPDSTRLNEEVIKVLHERGRSFLSTTSLKGTFWIRVAVLGFRTHIEHIDQCIEELKYALEKVKSMGSAPV